MAEIIKTPGSWNIRALDQLWLEEDWGHGNFPKFRDLQTVGDVLRIGPAGLKMRFREVDPVIVDWLFDELEALRK